MPIAATRCVCASWLLGITLLCLNGRPSYAASAYDQLASFGDLDEREVYLLVSVNGTDSNQLLRFRDRQGQLSTSADQLRRVGIVLPGEADNDADLRPLDRIADLRYRYNAATQSVNFIVADTLRVPYQLDIGGRPPFKNATAGRGVVLNYDAYVQTGQQQRLALFSEQRYFNPGGVWSNTGTLFSKAWGNQYVRYDTYWSRSDPETMHTLRLGDTVTGALDWTRASRIAGVQWGKNFSLRPDLVTFPVSTLSASSVVPSAVDLYINGVRQYSSQVPAGPFVVNQAPGITGAGEATLVTRDALGRDVVTTVPLYIDTRMLAQGLSSYSVEMGFLRRQFSVRSFDYAANPVFSASGRYGVNDFLTWEGHSEGAAEIFNAGAGALIRLGQQGVISASLTGSAGKYQGTQAQLGYQYVVPQFSLDLQTTRAFNQYGDLGSLEGAAVPRRIDRATLSFPLPHSQSVALSYITYQLRDMPPARIGSIAYSVSPHPRLLLNMSAYKDFNQRNARGVYLSATLLLENRTQFAASVSRQNGQAGYRTGASRSLDYEGGVGWAVEHQRIATQTYNAAQLQYLGRYGMATGLIQTAGEETQASVLLSGGVVMMDGVVIPARRINDSFALVSTDMPNVEVLRENRPLGRTNSRGYLLAPDLNAYQANRVGIGVEDLPVDTRVDVTQIMVVPKKASGVLAHFPLRRYAAAAVILKTPDGKLLPLGAEVTHRESGQQSVVGYDGMTFMDNLVQVNHFRVEGKDLLCEAAFNYTPPNEHRLPTVGPVICLPVKGVHP